MHLSIHEKNESLGDVQAEPRRKCSGGGADKFGELSGEMGQMGRVKWGDVSQEHGPIAKVLSHGRVIPNAANRLEPKISLLLEELQRRLELIIDQVKLRLVPLRIALHLRLKRRQAQLLGA